MPPRRRSVQEDVGPAQTILIQQPPSLPTLFVSDFLKNNYFEMNEKLERTNECSICLDNIECKNCFTVLNCGHIYHLSCIIKCQPIQCPLCRQNQPTSLTTHTD